MDRTCSVSGCARQRVAKGMCSPHYYQARKGKQPGAIRKVGDDLGRFWSYVDKRSVNECWVWTGASDNHGYGVFYLKGKSTKASRASWMLLNGDIPPGQFVLHKCDKPLCVNPRHLFLGTQADNIADMWSKGRGRGNPRPPGLGEDHRCAKLKWASVAEMRSRYSAGESLSALARDYGVTPPTAWAVVHRRTWKSPPSDQ